MSPIIFSTVNFITYIVFARQILRFHRRLGYWPNVADPKNFHEKMLWRKIFDRDPLFTELSDKLKAKEHTAKNFPQVRFARVKWAGVDPNEIPEDILKKGGFFKANHSSSQAIFLDIGNHDRQRLTEFARNWLQKPYGQRRGEWGYKNIARKVFIEETLRPNHDEELVDYNFHISGGTVICVQVAMRIKHKVKKTKKAWVLDRSGSEQKLRMNTKLSGRPLKIHPLFDEMVQTAESMAASHDYVRVDFTTNSTEYFFGEFTFYSVSGFVFEYEVSHPLIQELSDRWDLNRSRFVKQAHHGIWKHYANALRNKYDTTNVKIEN